MNERHSLGAAAVEMAITLALLLWLVLGLIDMGRAIFTNIALQDAAQAAVSHAAFTEDASIASVESVAIASTDDSPTLTSADIDVACTLVPRASRDAARVRVVVSYDLDFITPLVGPAMGGSIQLTKLLEAERYFDDCSSLQEVSW